MTKRRAAAKAQREHEEKLAAMTPEEIEEMEKSIPEWKRGALVVQNADEPQQESGLFGKMKDKMKDTEAAKKFMESEDYTKLKEMRSNYQ